METKRVEVKSLLVPSVQELVSSGDEPLSTIPSRYVCPTPLDPPSDLLSSEVPVIDIQLLLAGDSSELQRLHSASSEWGFFQAVNHGVSSSVIESYKKEVKDFFNISAEEKKKYWQTPEDSQGFGQVFVVSEEQPLEWADTFLLATLPPFIRNPRLFPSLPHPFREALENYSTEIQKLALTIIDSMGQALGEETRNYLNEFFEEKINQAIRVNYYPPCPEPEKVIGLSPHSDGDALTILLQVNEVEGLQIKKDDKWISIKPLPNAFIVNVGDMLEILTNGVYRSIEHRAVVNRGKERLSVAAFHNPGLDLEIGPSPSLVTPENPSRFQRITGGNYLKGYMGRKLQGKSYLDVMRNQGSLGSITD
ncbi:hypothetical protein V2J09_010080 [Rumex salicifolius]